MVRHSSIFILAFAIGALSWAGQEHPNFLWLTIEDTSANEFGCYGNPDAHTPTIDRLAAEGIRYTNAWSVAPQCSTARSSLLTGCYGTTYNMDTHRYKYPQPESIPLYPKILRQAGYYTTNKHKTDYNIEGSDEWIRHAEPSEKLWDEAGEKDLPTKWQEKLGVVPGTISDELVSFIDFAPTVFNIIGIDTPEAMQGQAFLGPNRPAPRDYQFGFTANGKSAIRPMRTATDGEFHFIRHYISYRQDALRNQFQWRMPSNLAWDDYLFWEPGDNAVWNAVKYPVPPERLFNLVNDPYETRNLSTDPEYREKMNELEAALDQHIHDTADLGFFPVLSRFKDEGSLYEWVRHTGYDLPALHAAAKMAATARPQDVADLEALLQSEHSEMRFWGAVGFANLGSDGHAIAIPESLRRALEDPNGEVAVTAAEAVALLGDLDAGYHALVRLIREPMDRKNRMQFVKRREHNQRRYAGAALEMLSMNTATQPIVHRVLEACEEGRIDQLTDYEIQSLKVNLGQAPARSLYPDFDVAGGQLRRPMGPLP